MGETVYVVVVEEFLHRERVERFIRDWRKHVKYGLPEEIRREIIAEKRDWKEPLTKEDEERIKRRLRSLGYLE